MAVQARCGLVICIPEWSLREWIGTVRKSGLGLIVLRIAWEWKDGIGKSGLGLIVLRIAREWKAGIRESGLGLRILRVALV